MRFIEILSVQSTGIFRLDQFGRNICITFGLTCLRNEQVANVFIAWKCDMAVTSQGQAPMWSHKKT